MPPDATSRRAKVALRLARPEERDALEDLQRRASLALPDYREQLTANPDAIQLPLAQLANGQVIVAEVGGRVAGFAALVGGELDGLFVEPEQWGQGIGRALADEVTQQARLRGLAVTVTAGLTARGFYKKCGFVVEGDAETRFGPALRMSR
jgi:GNAT superfamily N-acetyltransferase